MNENIISKVYSLRYLKLAYVLFQTLWQGTLESHHLSLYNHIFVEFQKLVLQSLYNVRFSRPVLGAPSEPYHPHCLLAFQEIDGQGLRNNDCRNDVERVTHSEFLRDLFHRICGALLYYCRQLLSLRTRFGSILLSIPNTLFHCKKLWIFLCSPSPKNDLCDLVLKCSYQCASAALGQTPDTQMSRGTFYILPYTEGNAI